jgi:hypothetical protein
MPGMALLIDGAMQHAAHNSRQGKSGVIGVVLAPSLTGDLSSKELLQKIASSTTSLPQLAALPNWQHVVCDYHRSKAIAQYCAVALMAAQKLTKHLFEAAGSVARRNAPKVIAPYFELPQEFANTKVSRSI